MCVGVEEKGVVGEKSEATEIFLNLSKASSQVRQNRNNLVSPAHLMIWFLPFNCHIGPEFRLKPYVPTLWLPLRTVGRYCTEAGMCHPDLLSPFSEQKRFFSSPLGVICHFVPFILDLPLHHRHGVEHSYENLSSRNINWEKEGRIDLPTVPLRVECVDIYLF